MKYYIIFLSVYLFFSSCTNCSNWGDTNLGGEFTLFDGDKIEDRLIIYCTGRDKVNNCCIGGKQIIPPRENKLVNYVDLAKFNQRWIIAKSISYDEKISYWYIDKDFDINWEYDDGGVFYSRIQNNVYGPFEKASFIKVLKDKNIELTFF